MHVRTVCVKAEQKKAKLNNQSWLEEHQNFLAEGKLIVGGAFVACAVSHRYLMFTFLAHSCICLVCNVATMSQPCEQDIVQWRRKILSSRGAEKW